MGNKRTEIHTDETNLIEKYKAISSKLFRPVTKSIYAHRFEETGDLLEKARSAILSTTVSEEIREALHYDLMLYEYHYEWHPEVNDWTSDDYLEAMDRFSPAAKTKLGDYIRRRWILKIKLHADLDGFEQLDRDQVLSLLEDIPLVLSHGVWFELSTWAWEHQDLELIETTFERFLTHPTGYLDQARWQRVNMMYQLMTKKASERDVRETIKTLELIPQVEGFMHRLWPTIQEAGLATPEIEKLLRNRIKEVNSGDYEPGSERRTKSFIRGNR